MSSAALNLAAFPPGAAFLPALAAAWLAAPGDPAAGLLILPNRRAARAAAGAFLQANQGRPLLLPRIIAPGAMDEAGLALRGALDLPPAVDPLARQAILAKLILARAGAGGAPNRLPTAWALAADLAALLDEADEAEIDLATRLRDIVPAELAAHWQTTLQFLDIITQAWPSILAEMARLNPAARQAALLDAQAQFWAQSRPAEKIWLVTSAAGPALARLARQVAGLPQGRVILPGYDPAMDEAAWAQIDDSHPQSGIARLLAALGARRDEIALLSAPAPAAPQPAVPPGRLTLLSQALLPAGALAQWQAPGPPPDPAGLTRLASRDEGEDAIAIAMILRDALESPGRAAALITPDRQLAQRVAAILNRFGIRADDSAGEPLADTPPAILLRLLARAAVSEFAPLPLLALLKHPLTAVGEPPELCRRHARALERAALRGPRPPPGLDGLRYRLDQSANDMAAESNFLARLEARLKQVTGLPPETPPAQALRALLETAESLAATEAEPGAARLWAAEAGAALAEHLAACLPALESLPPMPTADLPDLLDALLSNAVIRKPRTRDGHPRIAIWGIQEAALQTVDVAVLAGLVEGVWPATPDPGPWLSRPMRAQAGLPAPEQKIGAAAHDLFSLCASCPDIILAAPTRRQRAPAIPARWLTRLEVFLAGAGLALPAHPAASWARQLDQPARRLARPRPTPRPPVKFRPRALSISDIATLMADPYAIYARKILNLRQLDGIDQESDPSQFGEIVHAGLEHFFRAAPDIEAPNAAASLRLALQQAMRAARPRAALQHWWEARLDRIADWVIQAEQDRRRTKQPPVRLALEQPAQLPVSEDFTLIGRADRLERRADGTIFIVDYKTGAPPKPAAVESGAAPQLPLEAVMAEAGAFGPDFHAPVTELAFWKLSGRHAQGEAKELFPGKPEQLRRVIDQAAASLPALARKFADQATAYLAAPHPDRAPYDDPYAGLTRRAEWPKEGDDDDA